MPSNLLRLGFALVLLLPLAWLTGTHGDALAAVTKARALGGNVAIALDGAVLGYAKGVDGGGVVGSVVEEGSARGAAPKKHLGAVSYEDITLEVGLSLERSLYDWISASWTGTAQQKSGAIVSYDANLEAQSSREFVNALITETTIPTLSAASKEPGVLTLKLSPERMQAGNASGKIASAPSKDAKTWLASSFRLELDGLDCSRVSKIDSFSVKQAAAAANVGVSRETTKEAGKLEFGNLKVTLSEVSAETWRKWHDDFVVRGNSGDKNEKAGRLVLLGQNLKDELAEIKLGNVGIYALHTDAQGEGVAQLQAELYVERMEFALKR
jgi:hypothetical protein